MAEAEARKDVFAVLEGDQIYQRVSKVVDEVKDLLSVSADDAGIMLREYRWKKAKLIDDWMADSEKVKRKCGCKFAGVVPPAARAFPDAACFVCTDHKKGADFYAMLCGHAICTDCWTHWIGAEMEKGPTAIFSKCPQHKCGDTIPEAVFRRFTPARDGQRYQQYVVTSFVQGVTSIKWCSAPACGRAIEYLPGGTFDVTCGCGNRFCFGCERVAHRPVPCDLVEKWQAKNASESENANWYALQGGRGG